MKVTHPHYLNNNLLQNVLG